MYIRSTLFKSTFYMSICDCSNIHVLHMWHYFMFVWVWVGACIPCSLMQRRLLGSINACYVTLMCTVYTIVSNNDRTIVLVYCICSWRPLSEHFFVFRPLEIFPPKTTYPEDNFLDLFQFTVKLMLGPTP